MIGKKLKARREQLGLTQEELAKKLGYKSKSTINKIELDINDVSQSKLIKLADALDVDPTYFIEDSTPEIPDRLLAYANAFAKLSDNGKAQALQYIEFLVNQEAKNDNR